jgi:cobalamin synthase
MGLKNFLFGMVWAEFRKHLMPNFMDVATAAILTLFFGLVSDWCPVGYAVFFLISLVMLYAVTRLVSLLKILLFLRRTKKKLEGVTGLFKK